jgi:hypothetical protein
VGVLADGTTPEATRAQASSPGKRAQGFHRAGNVVAFNVKTMGGDHYPPRSRPDLETASTTTHSGIGLGRAATRACLHRTCSTLDLRRKPERQRLSKLQVLVYSDAGDQVTNMRPLTVTDDGALL